MKAKHLMFHDEARDKIRRGVDALAERLVRQHQLPAPLRLDSQVKRYADVVGVHLAVAPSDIVECHVPPYEPEFRIELVKPARPF